MTDLTEAQKSYFAGIFDASGIMSLQIYKDARTRPVLEFRRADRALLDVLAQAFGGRVSPYKMKQYHSFYWRRCGASAQEIVRLIRPYLQVRGQEADKLLLWEPKPNVWEARRIRQGSWTGLGA